MLILKIALILIGALLTTFGYLIFAKEKYGLINNYVEDKKNNKYNDNYAKRVGLIELSGGFSLLVLGIVSLFLSNTLTVIVFVVGILGIVFALIVNAITSKNPNKTKR